VKLVAGALVSAWLCWTASAEAAGDVSIAVDATAPGTPLEPVWRFYGYDEVNYTTTAEGEALLRTLAAAHAAPVHVRTHFLFNSGDGTPALKWGSTNLYSEDAGGNPLYDYTLIDAIMDATVQSGVLPLVELGFMPKALSRRPDPYQNSDPYVLDGGAFYPPRDYDRWAALVTAWATHVKERYPGAGSSWQWELWNEPDIGYWRGTFEEYARLYDHTEAALHAVFPDASLGGPAVARPEGSFLTQFLEHCASGTNAVSGQTGKLRLHRAGFEAVAASAQFARTPIVISEADPDGCAACPATRARANAYRNSPAYGAYEVAMMKRTLDLAGELGVNLRGVLTWAFTFPGTPYFAGYRALATNGIHLPVLNAFQLLGGLSGDRLPVTSSGARPLSELLESSVRGQPDIDALAARDGSRIQILVWHYHDDLVDAPPAPVTVDVSVPPGFGSSASVTHQRVDDAHGDAYSVWVAQGSPAAPSASQLAALQEAMVPVELSPQHEVAVVNGAVSLSFDLPRFGISLLTLSPPNAGEAEVSSASDASSSCRLSAAPRSERSVLLALSLLVALAYARRRLS
jgi:xylan 1,4-beta-xylosidase